MAQKITVEQMLAQWAFLPNKFEVNVLNFEVAVGKGLVEIFRKSFDLTRFNAPGSPVWPERNDNRKHKLLYETGSLYDSIKYKRFRFAHVGIIRAYTDPAELRNANRQKRYFCYAKLHNMGGANAPHATGNAKRIKQRKFMGHTPYVGECLESNKYLLFNGFPK